MGVLLFKSTDTNAPTLSGTAGDLTNLLDQILVVNKVYTTANDSAFTDNSTEARLQGGTAFNLLPTPASGDRIYIGLQVPFQQVVFTLGTLGVSGTYVWEYWNGSAWTTLTVTDGTTGFTASGTVTWTAPGSWATNAVNSVTQYWVRVRASANPSTTPTVNSLSITGWAVAYSGTSQRAYQQGAGNSFFMNINDNGPGAGTGKEARIVGYETMSAIGTGTNPMPTVAQFTNGLFIRKSTTADATTRAWICLADNKTMYFFCATTDTVGTYIGFMYGDFYSFLNGDGYRTAIVARVTENSTSVAGSIESLPCMSTTWTTATTGHYIQRNRNGSVGALKNTATASDPTGLGGTTGGNATNISYPNPEDGGIYLYPILIGDPTTATPTNSLRGRYRGFWHSIHAPGSFNDGDTFTGVGDYAGKSFLVIKSSGVGNGAAGVYVLETSDSWEASS